MYLLGATAVVLLSLGFVACVRKIFLAYTAQIGDARRIVLDLVGSTVLGLGLVMCVSPLLFWWWIHGSLERYLWIISGPAPFSMLGSGPVQLWAGVLLTVAGVALITFGFFLRKVQNR